MTVLRLWEFGKGSRNDTMHEHRPAGDGGDVGTSRESRQREGRLRKPRGRGTFKAQ